jgi:hypothetical protein
MLHIICCANYGLWVKTGINVCSSVITNLPLWWRILIAKDVMCMWRQGHIRNLYTFNFDGNLTLLQK